MDIEIDHHGRLFFNRQVLVIGNRRLFTATAFQCFPACFRLNNHPLKAGGLELRTESPDTRRLND
ncbi:MAG: hypothetical protein ACU84H_04160, partial [Gammaproteobacteria bacterium]